MTFGIKPRTVLKGRKPATVEDRETGPTVPCSTVLSNDEEAIIVILRRHTLMSLDDRFSALQSTIPHLSRSLLHRCLPRHRINRRPDVEGDKPAKKQFKRYPRGDFHIDPAKGHTAEGKQHLYVAIGRIGKFAVTTACGQGDAQDGHDLSRGLDRCSAL